jgi:hypothetical protein
MKTHLILKMITMMIMKKRRRMPAWKEERRRTRMKGTERERESHLQPQ